MSLVIHTHIHEADVLTAVEGHNLNLAHLFEILNAAPKARHSVEAQIHALGQRNPTAANALSALFQGLALKARIAADHGTHLQRHQDTGSPVQASGTIRNFPARP